MTDCIPCFLAIQLEITRAGSLGSVATVTYQVTGAVNAADFASPLSGVVRLDVGVAAVGLTLQVLGDALSEPGEAFTVTLPDPLQATIGVASAAGVIRNDDVSPGTSGNDPIYGTAGDDIQSGGGGNDLLFAGDGNDTVERGSRDDTIECGDGDDTLDGGSGNDTLIAGGGNDRLIGGPGNDKFIFSHERGH